MTVNTEKWLMPHMSKRSDTTLFKMLEIQNLLVFHGLNVLLSVNRNKGISL